MSAAAPKKIEVIAEVDSVPISFTGTIDETGDVEENSPPVPNRINFTVSSANKTVERLREQTTFGVFQNIFVKIPGVDPLPLIAKYPTSPTGQISKLDLMIKVMEDIYKIFWNRDFNVSVQIPGIGEIRLAKISSKTTIYNKFYKHPIPFDTNELPKAYLEMPGCNWFPIYEFTWKKIANFTITEECLMSLKAKGVPDEILSRLEHLKNQKIEEEKFLNSLEITIGKKQFIEFKTLIMQVVKVAYEGSILESKECGAFPKIKFEYEGSDFHNLGSIKRWTFSLANNSIQAFILCTRLIHLIVTKRALTLNFFSALSVTISFPESPIEDFSENMLLASLYRKLKFLEIVFNYKFKFQEISHKEVLLIDEIFRGITEGSFWTRSAHITVPNMALSREGVTRPPYTSTASIGASIEDVEFILLGNSIHVGKVTFYLNKAELIDDPKNSLIDKVFKEPNQTYDVPFAILDHLIRYDYEDYLEPSKKAQVQELLDTFCKSLRKQEPDDLVDLVNQPLLGAVDEKEAQEIAKGWLLYNRFSPLLFTSGEPEVIGDSSWRVPILWQPFPQSEAEVGELEISGGGIVLNHTSLQKIRARSVEASVKLKDKGIVEYSYYKEQPHRAIILVKQIYDGIEKDNIEAVVPSWDPDKTIKFSKESIEDTELANNLKPEMILSAEVNMAAKNIGEFTLKNFLLVTEPNPNSELFQI